MRPTVEYIEQCIRDINEQCFGGELPMLPVVLSRAGRRLGSLSYMKRRGILGRTKNDSFKMTISTRYDMAENVIRDTICHEMIHYYIAWKNIKDTSAHGEVFRRIMTAINEKYGYHMTVSHRLSDEEVMSAPKNKTYIICVSTFDDGRMGITISAKTRLFELWEQMPKVQGVRNVRWYVTRNPFFSRYRSSLRPAAYIVKEEELMPQLQDAKPLVRVGNKIMVTSQ